MESINSAKLDATELLHGALFAMEHAGDLLHDAVLLYDQGRYASAVVLGVFCREELGRSGILLEIRKQTRDSGGATRNDVKSRCEDHVTKLRQGQMAVSTRLTADQGRKLLALWMTPRSKEYREYRAALNAAIQQKARRDSEAFQQRRVRALYVDPDERGGWSRPRDESAAYARDLLDEVGGDYAIALDNLAFDDSELKEAIAGWAECPELPVPVSAKQGDA